MTILFLDQTALSEKDANAPGGGIRFTIYNFADQDIHPSRLIYTGVMRPLAPPQGHVAVDGGDFQTTIGSYTAIGLTKPIPAGGHHEITLRGMSYPPTGRSRGAITAWLETYRGDCYPITIGDVTPPDPQNSSPPRLPSGRIDTPLGLLPWPAEVEVESWCDTPRRYAPANAAAAAAIAPVAALHRRLFPTDPSPFMIRPAHDAIQVSLLHDSDLAEEAYALDLGDKITIRHSDPNGARHGLIALAQIGHAALTDAAFRQPLKGRINDAPRFGWRGCLLDVARNFFDLETIKRLLDVMAWLKMNQFHWHATEDEAWRLPSRAFQSLTALGGTRERGSALLPQYYDGPEGCRASYTHDDVAELVAYADRFAINIIPELELPGHATALLESVEGLKDPGEKPDSYRSVQGFANNALNPGLERTYHVLETLLRETAELFPGPMIHIGSDEVEHTSWQNSPAAQALAEANGLANAMELQAHMLRRVQGMVNKLGKTLGGWDECAEGGGIAPENTVLFAWRHKGKMAELIARGYDVVATPGQAYYLDMMQRGGWDGFGISWAGLADPQSTYAYDPGADLPDGPGQLLGVQACIWSEYLATRAHLNAMMFPRFAAVAEAGWTPQSARDWLSFCARRHLVPQL